ncbi:hypothetical protein VTH82DRAFT_4664 [Thermothelomyces myriococcoides]
MDPKRGEKVAADLEARFERRNVVYKTVEKTAIEAVIFIPKTLTSSSNSSSSSGGGGGEATSAPVLVHFHGGCLITGAVPEPFFLVDWVRDLAYTTNAIFVSAGYRLAPETPAADILDDVVDFWRWVHNSQDGLVAAVHDQFPHVHVVPDLNRLAAVGESAGGYLALRSGLHLHHEATTTTTTTTTTTGTGSGSSPSPSSSSGSTPGIRAVIAQYPSMFTDLSAFDAVPAGGPDAAIRALVAEWAAARLASGTRRVSAPWPGDLEATFGALTNGLVRELVLGPDPEGRLTLRDTLERTVESPPPIWIVQGDDDNLVPHPGSDEVVAKLRAARPAAEIKYTVVPGGWHGFDALNKLDDDWVKEGVEFIKRHWLGN